MGAARALPVPIRARTHASSPPASHAAHSPPGAQDYHETLSTGDKLGEDPSAGWLDRFDGQELDRQLDQRSRAVRDFSHELHRVAGFEQVGRVSAEVLDPAR